MDRQVYVDEKGDWYHSASDEYGTGEDTQLERQDQLQEMVGLELPLLESRFHGWLKNEAIHRKYLDSMEQLWLAFVMKEKYGKVWDGKSWTKGDKDEL